MYSTFIFDIGKVCAFAALEIHEIAYWAAMVDTNIEHGINCCIGSKLILDVALRMNFRPFWVLRFPLPDFKVHLSIDVSRPPNRNLHYLVLRILQCKFYVL